MLWTLGLVVIINLLVPLVAFHFPHHLQLLHWMLIGVGASIFLLAGVAQLRRGLSPIEQLQKHLSAVRDGKEARVVGDYPSEVQPLVDSLNRLLDDQQRQVTRAQAKAGDLAHGLKTPLAILALEADRASHGGREDVATAIRERVDRMRTQIDYHLAQARAAASGATLGTRCLLRDSIDGLVRTLQRLYADRHLTIDVDIPGDLAVRGRREDIDEMLGNLLDNACKWTQSRIRIQSAVDGTVVAIVIDDDGAGIKPELREQVLRRGVRADEAAPGSGFGLAIVRELAAVYDGSISLDQSPAGGLRVQLRLPRG